MESCLAQPLQGRHVHEGRRRIEIGEVAWLQVEMREHREGRHGTRHDDRHQAGDHHGDQEHATLGEIAAEPERDDHHRRLREEALIGERVEGAEPWAVVDEGEIGAPIEAKGAIPGEEGVVPQRPVQRAELDTTAALRAR